MIYPDDERREIHSFIPWQSETLLDVGCSQGSFGRGLREAGFMGRMTALEPEPAAARLAESNYDEVREGYFPGALDHSERFDCIVFNDVLEHLIDPWEAVSAAHQHLTEIGVVVASMPNMRYWPVLEALLFRRRWDYTDTGVLDRTHLRWFTRDTMVELFERNGYVVERVAPINSLRSQKLRLLGMAMPGYARDIAARQYAIVARRTSAS